MIELFIISLVGVVLGVGDRGEVGNRDGDVQTGAAVIILGMGAGRVHHEQVLLGPLFGVLKRKDRVGAQDRAGGRVDVDQ